MNSTHSSGSEAPNPRKTLPSGQTDPVELLDDDFTLIQLDTMFVTLLTEISTLQQQGDDRGRQEAQNVCSDETSRMQKIESVLARLEPVERAIMAVPARTIVGLGIKARHAAYVVSEHWHAPIEQTDWDARAIRLLIEAICEAAGVPLPFPTGR
jgi:hypothetical protein